MQTIKILISSIQIRIQDLLWRWLISIVLSSRGFLTLLSSYLEFTLDLIHSFFFSIIDTFTTNPITTSRAWWDNKKGSAIVIYAPNVDNQNGELFHSAFVSSLIQLFPYYFLTRCFSLSLLFYFNSNCNLYFDRSSISLFGSDSTSTAFVVISNLFLLKTSLLFFKDFPIFRFSSLHMLGHFTQ